MSELVREDPEDSPRPRARRSPRRPASRYRPLPEPPAVPGRESPPGPDPEPPPPALVHRGAEKHFSLLWFSVRDPRASSAPRELVIFLLMSLFRYKTLSGASYAQFISSRFLSCPSSPSLVVPAVSLSPFCMYRYMHAGDSPSQGLSVSVSPCFLNSIIF